MALFFFVVGLEIKRELVVGHLSTVKKAILPVAAAVGGMVLPAFIYILLNSGGEGTRGWGVPMATDIAFALGILAVLGPRVPEGLRVFLTAVAIADDLGAVLVHRTVLHRTHSDRSSNCRRRFVAAACPCDPTKSWLRCTIRSVGSRRLASRICVRRSRNRGGHLGSDGGSRSCSYPARTFRLDRPCTISGVGRW
jgi:hypothetical protein